MKNGMIEEAGAKKWYVDDKLHRLDGPAIERSDGIHDWYIEGRHICMCIDNLNGTMTYYVGSEKLSDKEFKLRFLKDYLQEKLEVKETKSRLKI